MKKFVLASNNNHKIHEIKKMLPNYEVLSLKDVGFLDDILEDGETFLDNALIKARVVSRYLRDKNMPMDVLADDTGLCVNALGGAPGVHSARFAGDHNDASNRERLLKELQDKEDRSATFQCQIVWYHPDDTYQDFLGVTEGRIEKEVKGTTIFGYDCLFYSNDLGKTFGEATEEEKNSVSHRGRAIQQLKEFIEKK